MQWPSLLYYETLFSIIQYGWGINSKTMDRYETLINHISLCNLFILILVKLKIKIYKACW